MASSSTSTNVGNMVVVTHVLPAAATGGQQPSWDRGGRFRRVQPKALGTVQIMIGLIVLLFGIAIAAMQQSLGSYCGIFVWGAAIYIASGSVTVAAEKNATLCLINASLVMNIIAAVVAGIGTILYTLDGAVFFNPFDGYYLGFSALLALFQLLQFIVSITVAVFCSSETCGCCREPQVVVQTADGAFVAQAPPPFQPEAVDPAQPHPQAGPYYKSPLLGSTEPPAYEFAP